MGSIKRRKYQRKPQKKDCVKVSVKLGLFLGIAALTATFAQAGENLKNLDTAKIKAQTEVLAKALLRVEPLAQQFANGQIDALKNTLATDEWKNIITDLQSYL